MCGCRDESDERGVGEVDMVGRKSLSGITLTEGTINVPWDLVRDVVSQVTLTR